VVRKGFTDPSSGHPKKNPPSLFFFFTDGRVRLDFSVPKNYVVGVVPRVRNNPAAARGRRYGSRDDRGRLLMIEGRGRAGRAPGPVHALGLRRVGLALNAIRDRRARPTLRGETASNRCTRIGLPSASLERAGCRKSGRPFAWYRGPGRALGAARARWRRPRRFRPAKRRRVVTLGPFQGDGPAVSSAIRR